MFQLKSIVANILLKSNDNSWFARFVLLACRFNRIVQAAITYIIIRPFFTPLSRFFFRCYSPINRHCSSPCFLSPVVPQQICIENMSRNNQQVSLNGNIDSQLSVVKTIVPFDSDVVHSQLFGIETAGTTSEPCTTTDCEAVIEHEETLLDTVSGPSINYDAMIGEWSRKTSIGERCRRQPIIERLPVPSRRRRELDSASQIAKLDFLERHLQLLAETLLECPITLANPRHSAPRIIVHEKTPDNEVAMSSFTVSRCTQNEELSTSHRLPLCQTLNDVVGDIESQRDCDGNISRRYAEDCLRDQAISCITKN